VTAVGVDTAGAPSGAPTGRATINLESPSMPKCEVLWCWGCGCEGLATPPYFRIPVEHPICTTEAPKFYREKTDKIVAEYHFFDVSWYKRALATVYIWWGWSVWHAVRCL